MKEFVNKQLTAIIGIVFALIVVIVLAIVLIGGNDKDKNPGTENPGTEVSTEIGTESTETVGDVEDTENTDVPSSETTSETPSTEVTTPETPSTEGTDTPSVTPQPQAPTYTYTDMNKTMYAKSSVNVRDLPSTDGTKIGSLSKGQAVTVTGQCNETKWYRINLNGTVAYVSNSYLVDNKPAEETPSTPSQPSQPDTPSGGGQTFPDHDYITVNGMTLDVTDYNAQAQAEVKALANAGYYEPVWNGTKNRYEMLIKRTDDDYEWTIWLHNYIEERGGDPGNGGGNNFCDVAGEAYKIYVYVEQ